jgi:hypothetical protein
MEMYRQRTLTTLGTNPPHDGKNAEGVVENPPETQSGKAVN